MNRADLLLSVAGLSVHYDSIKAVDGISFEVARREIVTLIGANGAGKSSILRAISGLVPYTGSVTFAGKDLRNLAADQIVAAGIAHVPEGRGIFGNLTVWENLQLACWQRKDKTKIAADLKHVFELFPRLSERSKQLGGMLSGGEQQMLAVGRALMARPKLIMMDEPSLGLAPLVVRDIFSIIHRLRDEGITILLIEQNANAALRAADYGYVLETGRITMEGAGMELLNDQRVRDAYLGQARKRRNVRHCNDAD